MTDQIIDVIEPIHPGPMGDLTPEARAALEEMRELRGNTKAFQDAAVSNIIADASSLTMTALYRLFYSQDQSDNRYLRSGAFAPISACVATTAQENTRTDLGVGKTLVLPFTGLNATSVDYSVPSGGKILLNSLSGLYLISIRGELNAFMSQWQSGSVYVQLVNAKGDVRDTFRLASTPTDGETYVLDVSRIYSVAELEGIGLIVNNVKGKTIGVGVFNYFSVSMIRLGDKVSRS